MDAPLYAVFFFNSCINVQALASSLSPYRESSILLKRMHVCYSIYIFKLDISIFVNNSTNILIIDQWSLLQCVSIHLCDISIFLDLFALLSAFTYLDRHGPNGMISPWRSDISDKDVIKIWFCLPETENGFTQETHIENQYFDHCLRTNLGKNETSHGKGHTWFLIILADLFHVDISWAINQVGV